MRYILTIEDTPRGIKAGLQYELNQVTDSAETSLSLETIRVLVTALELQRARGLLRIEGDHTRAHLVKQPVARR